MARKDEFDKTPINNLILESLEHEMGGVRIYETALQCVLDSDLEEEWTRYLDETRRHVEVLTQCCMDLGIDPDIETPGREITRDNGVALVTAMEKALAAGEPPQAQLVACDCVVLAETKDHANWQLLAECAKKAPAPMREALSTAVEEVEEQEDEHLYHSKGWARELWMEWLGFRAVLPPPEERKHVKTAIGAARARQQRAKLR